MYSTVLNYSKYSVGLYAVAAIRGPPRALRVLGAPYRLEQKDHKRIHKGECSFYECILMKNLLLEVFLSL